MVQFGVHFGNVPIFRVYLSAHKLYFLALCWVLPLLHVVLISVTGNIINPRMVFRCLLLIFFRHGSVHMVGDL